jgi:hypothetical protein
MTPAFAQVIRDKLRSGLLPSVADPYKIRAGYGHGEPCDGCDRRIGPAHVFREFDGVDGTVFRLHLGCHGVYVAELQRLGMRRLAS